MVRYVITPSVNGCEGTEFNLDVTVLPDPQVEQPANIVVCNGENIQDIEFISPNRGGVVSFAWEVSPALINLSEAGEGIIPGFKAVNTGNIPIEATVEVTPRFTLGSLTCTGIPVTFTITVNPTAQVNYISNQVVCNDSPTLDIVFTTINDVGTTTYTWENNNETINLPEKGEGDILSFQATNTGDAPVVATIVVTPHFTNGEHTCDGPSRTFTITVDPTPQVVPSTLSQIICNDGTTHIVIGSPSTYSSGKVTFTYTVSATGGVTGFTIPSEPVEKDYIIEDVLNNSTDEVQTVTYTIYPVTPITGCASGPAEVVVTVLPTPKVTKPSDLTFCNGELTSEVNLNTITSGNVSFTWENNTSSIGLDANGSGNIPAFTTSNYTDSHVTATITVTPHFEHGTLICDGEPVTFTITVNPTPTVVPVVEAFTLCNEGTTSIRLTSLSTFSNGDIHFRYEAESTGGVTGFDASESGLSTGFVIADELYNTGYAPQTVTYTIYPVDPTGLCPEGPAVEVVITVNPTPNVVPVVETVTLCNEGTTSIRLTSLSSFSNGDTRFRYEAESTGGVTGFDTSEDGLEIDFVIDDDLYNSTDEPQTVTYTIYPLDPTGLCSEGPPVEVEITVNPTPRIYPFPDEQNIRCNEFPVNITLNSPSLFSGGSLVTINLSATAPEGVGGFSESVTGLPEGHVINDILVNETYAPLDVEYTVVPVSPFGCASGQELKFRVTVNPTPLAIPVNVKPAICYSDETLITLASPTEMTSPGRIVFDYTVSVPPGVTGDPGTGFGLETGEDLSFEFSNNDAAVQPVYFYITPKVAGLDCPDGDMVTQEVQVHPVPARDIEITQYFTCDASSGKASLRAEISSGAEPYKILWKGPVSYTMSDVLEISGLYAGNYTVYVEDNIGCTNNVSEQIYDMSAKPIISPWPVLPDIHVSCPGGSNGTARFYVRSGITGPYNYRIYRNDTELVGEGTFSGNYVNSVPTTYVTPDNLRAGEYKLVVTDKNGCETFSKVELFEPDPIRISFEASSYDGSNISCRGHSDGYIIASVTGGNGSYSYYWSAASGPLSVDNTTNVLTGVPAGTYYLTVTDLLGCPMTESVTLTDPPGMILSGSEVSHSLDRDFHISCNGASDGYINLEITGGSGNYTYLWVGPGEFTSTDKDISNLWAGIYTCTVTDINGCTLFPAPRFELREPEPLEIDASLSSVGNWNIRCAGGTGTADITVTGGSEEGYFYSWSTNGGSGIIAGQEDQNALRKGNYSLTVTDFNGCPASIDFSMTEPEELTSELIPGHITCQESGFNDGTMNLTVTGGVAPYSYLWSNGEMTQDITGLTEGRYTVTVTDANDCKSSATEIINLPPPLSYEKTVSVYNGFNISCYGRTDGYIQITPTSGTPPYVFRWQGPDGFTADAASISGLSGGIYILDITDKNHCTATETIELREPGRTGMTVTLEDIICAGEITGSISVEPVNNAGLVDYLWADGEIGKTRTGLRAGDYKLILTDSNGCSADSVITLNEPDSISLSFSVTQPLCTDLPNGQINLTVTGGTGQVYTYLWSDNSTSQDLGTAVSGLYSVTVTDESGCMVTGSVIVNPVNELCLDIPNAISPNGDLRNDVWNIGLKDLYPEMEVKIFNRWGEMIWKSDRGYPVPWDGRSRGEILPIDSYHYIIDLNNGTRPLLGHITIVK